jgi:ParB family chromosome partitioning protein
LAPSTVSLVDIQTLKRNPDNPRLIFHQAELDTLQSSISQQGILVPLTVFEEGKSYRLLDGERRWKCALKLGLLRVPVIVQPKPARLQNIMMMFAIHNARRDWDPLPTAIKLGQLEQEFKKVHGRSPTETELAGLASLSRGEVRRLKKLLALPEDYKQELLVELEKPRAEQVLTVDHVVEVTTAASVLRKQGIVNAKQEDSLRRSLLTKFRRGVLANTVEPRKLGKLAAAVKRQEVELSVAKRVVERLISEDAYSVEAAFRDSVEQVEFERGLDQLLTRVTNLLTEHERREYAVSPELLQKLEEIRNLADSIIRQVQ